ncbi:MAG: hypothetical protein PHU25_01710 [Deltaproteobacteria bacterium]|nr:hypothetical protein [Deltaproteobacteria bacterium]
MSKKTKTDLGTCYMCDQRATTREHVPPQCLFPEKKDTPDGTDYRINLVKVPSCAIHNLSKSADDEYLMAILVMPIGNNDVAVLHAGSKVLRALVRNNGALVKKVLHKIRPVEVDGQPTLAVKIDTPRIYAELEKIGRALYFKHFGKKWVDQVFVATASAFSEDPNVNKLAPMLKELDARLFGGLPRYGENPDVFFYQVTPQEALPQAAIRMVFYGGFEAVVVKKMDV